MNWAASPPAGRDAEGLRLSGPTPFIIEGCAFEALSRRSLDRKQKASSERPSHSAAQSGRAAAARRGAPGHRQPARSSVRDSLCDESQRRRARTADSPVEPRSTDELTLGRRACQAGMVCPGREKVGLVTTRISPAASLRAWLAALADGRRQAPSTVAPGRARAQLGSRQPRI